jgi:hypothetical protein
MITETKMIAPMTSRMTRSIRPLYGSGGALNTGQRLAQRKDCTGRIYPMPHQTLGHGGAGRGRGGHLAVTSTDSVVCATWS